VPVTEADPKALLNTFVNVILTDLHQDGMRGEPIPFEKEGNDEA
jgi:hypothetical protein